MEEITSKQKDGGHKSAKEFKLKEFKYLGSMVQESGEREVKRVQAG